MNIEKYLPKQDIHYIAAMHLQQSKNPFKQQAQNNRKIELSIRMLQYINTYNLRRDQILYQCPILKSSLQEPQQFDAEVQCLEEMADIDIVYRSDRKKELAKIREKEMQALEKIRKEQESKKGFFGGLFSSKSKSKNKSNTLSPLKLKIDQSALKSSTYVKKMQQDQSTMIKSKMTSNQESQHRNSNLQIQKQPSQNSNNVVPVSQFVSPVISKNKSLGQQQSPIALLDQKKNQKGKQELKADQLINSSSKKTFSQEQFVQVDEDQLLDADQSKDAHQMSKIIQQKQESQILQSVRQSHVSRISLNDLSENQNKKKQRGRLSKRNRKRIDSEDEDQQTKRKEKQKQMLRKMELTKKQSTNMKKKKSVTEAPKILSKQKDKDKDKDKDKGKEKDKDKESGQETSNKLVQQKNKQKIIKKQSKIKQLQNEDVLSSYISHQISRLSNIKPSSEISNKSSEIYSFLSSADIQSYSDPHQIQKQQQDAQVLSQKQKDKDDSYSDIHIDWLVKIQACELQEKLLMNRIKQRWVQPLKALGKIRDLRIEHLTYEASTDARLIWTKPYLNFGRVIQ